MITIFNRKEICFSYDIKKQTAIREILAKNDIKCIVKTFNTQTTSSFGRSRRTRYGSFGVDSYYTYQYKVYVNKNDYEKAKYLIRDL